MLKNGRKDVWGMFIIQSMGDDSFRTVYSDILGKYNNCEGIVIDTVSTVVAVCMKILRYFSAVRNTLRR